jgi:GTP-binding protein Era
MFLAAVDPFVFEGPQFYDPEDITDASMRFFAAEFIRKQIILNTREEVPHASFVEIESYKENDDQHHIDATIHVETVGQRGIIVGKGGIVIAKIRKAAEQEMRNLVKVPIFITCHIKVTPKWRDNESFLRNMGLPLK